ncbi:hypothetical protein BUALT_Bualt03G0105000 [Buddleja alternifolia]|uniref:Uncharacterized protein n=1 Tax=Buddleja alternifolia TaxID=168488 RepID=A0AAV6Y006_9LAMI|nr:hypothetical protein BUALT_Bualt03G0105000 [Buddleja alternifolia]
MRFSKSNVSGPVFIDTNLGTHLAVPVSSDITVKEFKRELEKMHLNCFPEFGNIRVNALMVKQKSCCYHLSESLPLKYAFVGSDNTWFLQMDVHRLISPDLIQSFQSNGTEVRSHKSVANVVTDSVKDLNFLMRTDEKRMKLKRKKRKMQRYLYLQFTMLKIPAVLCFSKRKKKRTNVKRKYKTGPIQNESVGQFATRTEVNCGKRWDTNVIAEAISETFSESVSVSGIIKKYFSDYDEVASSSGLPFTTVRDRHNERTNSRSDCKYLNIQSEKNCKKPEVGKRLLRASDNLGLSPSDQRPALSFCKLSDRKSPCHKSSAIVRNLVFEIAQESD